MARVRGYRFGRSRVREAATSLLRQAPSVLRLFGRLMADARVSIVDRGLVGAALVYVISPFDLIPDFLSVIGVVDDLFLIGLVLDRLLMRAPVAVVEDHWEGTPDGLESLTAELKAMGDALPGPIRSVLYGRVEDGQWGHEFESADVYEAERDPEWPAAERARRAGRGASRPRRGREVAAFDDIVEDEGEDDEYGEERVDRYRNRL